MLVLHITKLSYIQFHLSRTDTMCKQRFSLYKAMGKIIQDFSCKIPQIFVSLHELINLWIQVDQVY